VVLRDHGFSQKRKRRKERDPIRILRATTGRALNVIATEREALLLWAPCPFHFF
jgi:hypothetical protein